MTEKEKDEYVSGKFLTMVMTREKIEALIARKRFEIKLCDINSKYLKPEDLRNMYYNNTKKLLLKSEILLLELLR